MLYIFYDYSKSYKSRRRRDEEGAIRPAVSFNFVCLYLQYGSKLSTPIMSLLGVS